MRGPSGRVVLEIEPLLKQKLYDKLALEKKTAKELFLEAVVLYLAKPSETMAHNMTPDAMLCAIE